MYDPTATTVEIPDELDELAALLREEWPARLTELRASGTPLMADDDDDDTGGDDDDDSDDDDDKAGKSGSGDDDDDDDDDEPADLRAAQRKIAAQRRELKQARKDLADRTAAEEKAQGKHKERADRLERELEELKAEQTTAERKSLVVAAAEKAGARNAETVFKLLKADDALDEIEDETDARRAVRELLKADPDLKAAKQRQKRDGGREEDDDREDDRDDDDRRRSSRNGKNQPRGPERLRRHFAGQGGKKGS